MFSNSISLQSGLGRALPIRSQGSVHENRRLASRAKTPLSRLLFCSVSCSSKPANWHFEFLRLALCGKRPTERVTGTGCATKMTTPNANKAAYIKLEKMSPQTHDHNIVVKVLDKKTVVDKTTADGRRILQEEILVGDDTGCMYLNAHDGQCGKLVVGKVVALHNAKVKLVNRRMRLTFDKWGSIKDTNVAIPGDVQTDTNFSETVYNQVVGGS